ncbi:MAG: ParB/Srx family N-terminal domain-containing protein [Clostridiales bacterium]|nr:ParB/Srx family N-terminal domain-containing protein [Clostridiales bacterium]
MEELKIEYISIDKLTPYDKNTKVHTKKQIGHIANSIKQFGFNDPLGVYGENNIVLEGNGRIEAAKILGIAELPCVRLDHLSKDEMRAYVIAHNSLNLETSFDDGALYAELKELQDFDFENFGLDVDKYLRTFVRVQKRLLKQLRYVHYLVSAPLNSNDELLPLINMMKQISGVEIESTTN